MLGLPGRLRTSASIQSDGCTTSVGVGIEVELDGQERHNLIFGEVAHTSATGTSLPAIVSWR